MMLEFAVGILAIVTVCCYVFLFNYFWWLIFKEKPDNLGAILFLPFILPLGVFGILVIPYWLGIEILKLF